MTAARVFRPSIPVTCFRPSRPARPQTNQDAQLRLPRTENPRLAVRRCHQPYAAGATETVGFWNPPAIIRTRVLESASAASRARGPHQPQFVVPVLELPFCESSGAPINWVDMGRAPLGPRLSHATRRRQMRVATRGRSAPKFSAPAKEANENEDQGLALVSGTVWVES